MHTPRWVVLRGSGGFSLSPRKSVFSVAAGILRALEPGILPGGMGVWLEKALRFRTTGPGGKMPPSTAAKMAAATDVNLALNTYALGFIPSSLRLCRKLLTV